MSSFQNLPNALDEGLALGPVEEQDLAFSEEKQADLAALKMVIQDTQMAERFMQSKTLVQEWNAADELFRAYVPVDTWPNSKNARSHIPRPVVMEAIEALIAQIHLAFFSDPQPFTLDPKGKTTPDAARAMAHLVCWAIEQSGFEEEQRKSLKSGLQYGTGISKYGWVTATHEDKQYSQENGDVKVTKHLYDVARPSFEYVDVHNVLVDPHTNCQDIRTAKYVIFQKFIDADELDELRDDYKNVPTRDELKAALVTGAEPTKDSLLGSKYYTWRENQAQLPTEPGSVDPLKQPLEILEYWTDEKVITVLQRTFVLRNEEHDIDIKPFLSACFIDVLNSFWGFGVAKLLAGEQSLQAGVLNKWVDWLSLQMNPMWWRKKGMGTISQNIMSSPGRVINEEGELAPVEMPSITNEANEAINASENRSSRMVGANFGPEMPTQAMRTAEGVNAFTSGVQTKLQYFIGNWANLNFVPAIEAMIELLKANLTPDQVKSILSEREAQAYQGDIMDVYNGRYKVGVLSSVKLAARRAMAQLFPILTQMLGQPAVMESFAAQGKKFDWVEFFNQAFDITGWPGGNLILDMTPEDQQRAMMNNQAAVKAMAAQQQLAQQHANDQQLLDQKGDVQGGVAVVKSLLKAHEVPPQALADQSPA